MQELPDKGLFSDALNSQFLLAGDGGQWIALDLVELREGRADPLSESYALLFRGPAAFVLPQQIYTLKQAAAGEFDLFLVPVRRDASGSYYEAVINHLRKP